MKNDYWETGEDTLRKREERRGTDYCDSWTVNNLVETYPSIYHQSLFLQKIDVFEGSRARNLVAGEHLQIGHQQGGCRLVNEGVQIDWI